MFKVFNMHLYIHLQTFLCHKVSQLTLYTAALLPEVQPAPCFLSGIIGET